MAWIESHEDVGQHWKTQKMSELSGKSIPETIGTLHLLWHFTLKNAWKDGDLKKYPAKFIADSVCWKGDPKKLIKILQSCQFLDGMKVHDWFDFCGDLVKKRIEYKQRKTTRIDNFSEKSSPILREVAPNSQHTEPNRTIPNHTVNTKTGFFNEKETQIILQDIGKTRNVNPDSEAASLRLKEIVGEIGKLKDVKNVLAMARHKAINQ